MTQDLSIGRVGRRVRHTNSHRTATVLQERTLESGSRELLVQPDWPLVATSLNPPPPNRCWWNSAHVEDAND